MSAFQALETLLTNDDTNGTSTTFRATVALAIRFLAENAQSQYRIDDVTMYNELKRLATNSSPNPLVPIGHYVNAKRM